MLFLGHVVIGLIIGFILYEFFKDKYIIVFCTIGSVLPDIIDKPMGYIIFNSSLDSGKIYFHSLGLFLVFFIAGIIIWKWYHSNSFLGISMGILVHQLVDLMWMQPVKWYYPFLGQFQTEFHPVYFQRAITAELSSVTELIFLIGLMGLGFALVVNKMLHRPVLYPDPLAQKNTRKFFYSLLNVALFVLILSIIIIYIWQPLFND